MKNYHIVFIILLLAFLLYNLVSLIQFREGITSQEIKDTADANASTTIAANKPKPVVKQLKFGIEIQDSMVYNECIKNPAPPPPPPPQSLYYGAGQGMGPGPEQAQARANYDSGYKVLLPFTATFTQLNPNMSYYVSGTSEGAPSQNVDVASFPLTYKNPINASHCNDPNNINSKSADIPATSPTNVTISVETGKFNGFILVAPKNGSLFPKNFTLTITNNNNLQLQLYGQYASGMSDANPIPSNRPIQPTTISKTGFEPKAYDASDNVIRMGGVNLGTEPLVIANTGDVTDTNNNNIGSVTTSNNTIVVHCTNSSDITGLIIYLGHSYVA
uniref:Uncharacterized protein n=1 Tax=viral metagenome TaxID=1070528 RepID=A0A6C0AT94_9ZZZZ